MTISAGRSTGETNTPKLNWFVSGSVIFCSDRLPAAPDPGLRSMKMTAGPATVAGTLNGFLAGAGMRAAGMRAPVPISRCGPEPFPIVGMVAVPTIVSGWAGPAPEVTSTVSPRRLCSWARVTAPRTVWSGRWRVCPVRIGGCTAAPGRWPITGTVWPSMLRSSK